MTSPSGTLAARTDRHPLMGVQTVEDDPPDDVLKEAATDELAVWGRTLPQDESGDEPIFPDPHTEQGLPNGWGINAQMTTTFDTPDTDWLLVRREAGGWLLVRHEGYLSRTYLRGGAITIGGLYEKVQRVTDRGTVGAYPELADWLRAVIVDAYDPTDEIEAAARVMVALGGPAAVTPRALA